jgi:hypothetical protein
VLFGDGKGNLTSSSTVAIADELASVSVMDFNNDGYPDILAEGYSGALYLLLNDKTGHFSSAVPSTRRRGRSELADSRSATSMAMAWPISRAYYNPDESKRHVGGNGISELRFVPGNAGHCSTNAARRSGYADSSVSWGQQFQLTSTSTGSPVTVTQTTSSLTWAQRVWN